MIDIYPDLLASLKRNRNRDFFLIVTPPLSEIVDLHPSKYYQNNEMIVCGLKEDINDVVINRVSKEADILFIPYQYAGELTYVEKSSLNEKQRFLNMAAASQLTPVTLDHLKHFIPFIHSLDPEKLKRKVNNFFDKISHTSTISFINEKYDTHAVLTLNEHDLWSEICGEVEPGEISILPYGELALTPYNFDELNPKPLALNGEIIFHGHPILHTVEISKNAHDEQNELFRKLLSLNTGAIKFNVIDGVIEDMYLIDQSAKEAYEVFERWFQENEKYRIVVEIGLGLNDGLVLVDDNCSLNETYGGNDICIHFGIGKPPMSGHHLDVISPSTKIMTSDQQTVVKKQEFSRKIASSCPCEGNVKRK